MNSEIFKALGSRTRLNIAKELLVKEHNVTDLTKLSKKNQTTISRHLATLKNAKIIKQRRKGRNIFYSIINLDMKNWLKQTINFKEKKETSNQLRNKIEIFLTTKNE